MKAPEGSFLSAKEKNTEAYWNAVDALEKMHPWEDRTFASIVQKYWEAETVKMFGTLRKYQHWSKWLKIKKATLAERAAYEYAGLEHWMDHPECRQTKTGKRYFLGHPYNLGTGDMRRLAEICERHELKCHIDTFSSYFPSRTLCVVLETKAQYDMPEDEPEQT